MFVPCAVQYIGVHGEIDTYAHTKRIRASIDKEM